MCKRIRLMQTIRTLIVDDQTIVRNCLRMLIDAQPDMEVVGEAQDSGSAIDKTRATKPDVVIMEIGIPDASGMGAIE
jgi:DNA-binding NarL/FixJ family response regulator